MPLLGLRALLEAPLRRRFEGAFAPPTITRVRYEPREYRCTISSQEIQDREPYLPPNVRSTLEDATRDAASARRLMETLVAMRPDIESHFDPGRPVNTIQTSVTFDSLADAYRVSVRHLPHERMRIDNEAYTHFPALGRGPRAFSYEGHDGHPIRRAASAPVITGDGHEPEDL